MKNNLPKSYRLVKTCVSCKHVFTKSDYDSSFQYFCTLNSHIRPLCGSMAMGESFCNQIGRINKTYYKNSNLWNKWANTREVDKNGICDQYKTNPLYTKHGRKYS